MRSPNAIRTLALRALAPATLLTAVAALGGVIVAALVVGSSAPAPLPLIGLFAIGFVIAQSMPVQIRRGRRSQLIGFEEAIAVPAILVLPPSAAMLALLASIPAWHAITRQPLGRAMFHAGTLVISFATAQLVLIAIAGPAPGLDHRAVGGVALAMAAMFAIRQLLVASMIAVRTGSRIRTSIGADLSTKCALWTGNVSFGLLVTPTLHHIVDLLPAAFVLLVLLQVGIRSSLRARQGDRAMTGLVASAARLGTDRRLDVLCERVADIACGIVGGCGALLRIDPVEVAALGDPSVLDGELPLRTQVGIRGRLVSVVALEADGRRLGELLVWRDVTEPPRSRAQTRSEHAALQILARQGAMSLATSIVEHRSRRHLAMISHVFEHAQECLALLDRHGNVTAWNPAAAQLTGLDAATMRGASIATVSTAIAEAVARGTSGQIEAAITSAPAGRRIVQASLAPVRSDTAARPVDAWVLAMHDVTCAHEAERLKTDFVATVSHELRTPLTTIRGFLETMRRDDLQLDEHQVATFLDIMRGEALRLERLINDLLDTSAIEAGTPPAIRSCTFDLAAEVRRAVLAFRTAHPQVPVTLHERSKRTLLVRADPDRVQQVLGNLLANAVRHGHPDRGIEVRLLDARSGQPGVSVRDHGPGVLLDEQERIFDRFYFTSDSVTRMGGGAGLGLYICRRLMQAMGGTISLHSMPGDGATFTLRLPAPKPARGRRRRPQVASNVRG
jgi:PAS domain S-box-containing protein